MNTFFIALVASFVTILALDVVWISTMAQRFYGRHIGHLLAEGPNFIPAGVFYLLYAAAITFFVVMPGVQGNSGFLKVFLTGVFLGIAAYGTYDLTNQATLKSWPTIVSAVDIAWGGLLTGVAGLVAVAVTRYFS